MRFLLCPDSFKGSLSSREVSDAIAEGILRVFPDASVTALPFGDGGEGTAACFEAMGAKPVPVDVKGPYGEDITACYYRLPDGKSAYIESAMACGLPLSPRRDTHLATTYGVGQLLVAAAKDCRELYLGLGGSATSDMGLGMAAALGFTFYDYSGVSIPCPVGGDLSRLGKVIPPSSPLPHITALCDVKNPLTGDLGAAAVFSPQKGADADTAALLDRGMHHAAALIDPSFEFSEGAGAAGGMGYAVLALLGGRLSPGAETVMSLLDLDTAMASSDIVITGEGRFDRQSLMGKVVGSLAEKAKKHRLPLYVLPGCAEEGLMLTGSGITGVLPLTCYPLTSLPDKAAAAAALKAQAQRLCEMLSNHLII